jgi:hypothetical protein
MFGGTTKKSTIEGNWNEWVASHLRFMLFWTFFPSAFAFWFSLFSRVPFPRPFLPAYIHIQSILPHTIIVIVYPPFPRNPFQELVSSSFFFAFQPRARF